MRLVGTPQVIAGALALDSLGEVLERLGGGRVLVVTSMGARKRHLERL